MRRQDGPDQGDAARGALGTPRRMLIEGAPVVLPTGAMVLLVLGLVARIEVADGGLVVFVPGAPAPLSAAIDIRAPEQVMPLDVPLLPFRKTIASLGLGLAGMVAAADHARPREPAA